MEKKFIDHGAWYRVDEISLEGYRAHVLPYHFRDNGSDGCEVKTVNSDGKEAEFFEVMYRGLQRSLPVKVKLQSFDKQSDDITVTGILDTGAESLCIKEGLAEKLGWKEVGDTKVSGANSTLDAKVWRGAMILQSDSGVRIHVDGLFLESPLPGSCDVLVGRPVLSKYLLQVYKGFLGFELKGKGNVVTKGGSL